MKDAMRIAKFTDDEIEDKKLRQKVLRRLPGKGKRRMIQLRSENAEEGSITHSIDVENTNNSDMSPITDNSTTSLLNSDSKQKQKSRQLTVSQKQEQRVNDFTDCASTAGKKFTIMGGNHLTSKGIFIAAEMSLRIKEKQRLVGLKKKFERAAAIEEKGKAVNEKKGQIVAIGSCMNSRQFLLGMVCRS